MRHLPVLALAALAACIQTPSEGQTQGATTSSGATGGSGGSTTGATAGSTTGAPASDGGDCSLDRTSSQGDDCIVSFPCGCPFVCSSDPLESLVYRVAGTYVCEHQCLSNSDCLDLGTACIDGGCAAIPCGGGTGNGLFDRACAMGKVPDSGTCVPIALQFVGVDAGVCEQGGTATVACNPLDPDRAHLNEVCAPGSICSDAGLCVEACDADEDCPFGEYCLASPLTPTDGICLDAGVP